MCYIQKKSNVLNDKNTDSKVYCVTLNNFLNTINVPSKLLVIAFGKSIINTVEQVNVFYEFFSSQCTPARQ